jgi:hypothetical protein
LNSAGIKGRTTVNDERERVKEKIVKLLNVTREREQVRTNP